MSDRKSEQQREAVALAYRQTDAAPRVVAKGRGLIAEEIISKAKVNTRGFIYVKKSRDILRESAELVNASVEKYFTKDSFDWGELKSAVRDDLSKYLFDQTKRRPSILPVIMEVK